MLGNRYNGIPDLEFVFQTKDGVKYKRWNALDDRKSPQIQIPNRRPGRRQAIDSTRRPTDTALAVFDAGADLPEFRLPQQADWEG